MWNYRAPPTSGLCSFLPYNTVIVMLTAAERLASILMTPFLITATATIVAVFITQYIIRKRERAQLRLRKLEELYALLVAFGNHNNKRVYRNQLEIAPQSINEVMTADFIEKIEMYVDFYFPDLRKDFDELQALNSKLNFLLIDKEAENMRPAIDDAARDLMGKIAFIRGSILAMGSHHTNRSPIK